MQRQQEPLLLADDGTYVDVTNFVRFELNHGDIRYGVLDLIVQFPYKGQRAQCYLLHFFPVDTVKENVKPTFPEWTEGCHFPPALLKLRATVEGTIIPLYHQECIAINTRGATIYGARRTLVRRMILHTQHHEDHLLTVLADAVPAREIATNMDSLEAFLQHAPFQARYRGVQDFGRLLTGGSSMYSVWIHSQWRKVPAPTPGRAHTPSD